MDSEAKIVSRNKFEFEEDGHVAYLEFEVDSAGWLTLLHTEVPAALQGRGVATLLARTAFEHARDNSLKVDVICPVAANFVAKHPEFQHLVGR
jgi:hypothetical protein